MALETSKPIAAGPDETGDAPATGPSIAQRMGLWAGPMAFAATFALPAPAGMESTAWVVAGLALWMAIWWASEAVPMAATALLPLVFIPFLGAGTEEQAAAPYANPIVLLLLGGSIVAVAIERWGLHKRLALFFLSRAAMSAHALVLAFMAVTAFVSMWVSNTAASLMMMPIALSVAAAAGGGKDMTKAMVLGVAYAATLGGIATPIGTPTNLIAMGWLTKEAKVTVTFLDWVMVGLPALLALLPIAWWVVTQGMARQGKSANAHSEILASFRALGPMDAPQARVLGVFAAIIALWVGAEWLRTTYDLKWLRDMSIVMAGAIVMMVLPAGGGQKRALLTWAEAQKIPWHVILLFGGGISLAGAMERSGLADWMGAHMQALQGLPPMVVVGVIVGVVIVMTEFMSNVATITMLLPILGALALAAGVDPVVLVVPAAIAASCGFMMPAGTGPNAVAAATGQVSVAGMMGRGLFVNIAALIVMTLVGVWLAPLVLG
jgi:solute carrier family 13 (sodium-dependent dicarboxylate transporter), member 2/3/5